MAPRRLLLLMLGLLLASSLLATLIPSGAQHRLDTTAPKTGQKRPVPKLPKDGRLLQESIDADAAKKPTIKASVGDQLDLEVTGKTPATIEIQGLGDTADVDPNAPATFNLLLLEKGTFAVQTLGGEKKLGTIEVGAKRGGEGQQPRSSRGSQNRSPEGAEVSA